MHGPPHLGEILRGLYLEPLRLSAQESAEAFGVSRTALTRLVNGRTHLSPEMAQRLATAFDTTVKLWLNLQHAHDVARAHQTERPKVRRLVKKTFAG